MVDTKFEGELNYLRSKYISQSPKDSTSNKESDEKINTSSFSISVTVGEIIKKKKTKFEPSNTILLQ